MPDFRLPDLGEGLEEAEIVTWTVQVGDRVEIDQIVVEVETAKAAVEVPIPFAGVVSALHAGAGATVRVGAPLISISPVEPSVVAAPAAPGGLREPGVVTAAAAPVDGDSGNVLIGYGTTTIPRRAGRRRRRADPLVDAPPVAVPAVAAGPVPVISPLVRKLARDAGLDLRRTPGTGPSGLVTRGDVDRARSAAIPAALAAPVPPPAASPAAPPAAASPAPGETRIPLRGLRKAVADKLARSRREIPEATVWVDVDATELLAARVALNARAPHEPVSLLALIARFTLLGLRRYPELNARIDGDEIVIPDHVHLGFAAQTERGLVVPVVRDAHRLSTRDLSAALGRQTSAARDGKLAPAELSGSTITVNNYGVFGVDGSAAIINHPEVAIVGIGRIIDRPWVLDGQLTVRKVSQLTLAFDHRACDGATAGGFLRYLADCVEAPVVALGEL